jgi:CRISPR-associated endonuclease Csn1
MAVTLGLDLGSSSIGWALVSSENNQIIDMGSRVFPAGVENMNQSKEQSKNVSRREARSIRKRLERRKMRKNNVWNILKFNKFIEDTLDFKEKFFQLEPYSLRAKASIDSVTLVELARVLYNLTQRRGYKDISDATKDDDSEKGAIFDGKDDKPGIMAVREILKSGEYRTLGHYLSSLNTHEIRIRNRFTERSMYEKEFETIWNVQSHFHSELDDELKERFKNAIFFQRPLKSQKSKLGKCKFEPHHYKCAKSHPRAQLFRMYQQVNNFTIQSEERLSEESQLLSGEERDLLINHLLTKGEIELGKDNKKIAKILNLNTKILWKTNYDRVGKLKGCITQIRIKSAISKNEINNITDEDIFDTWHIIISEKDADHKKSLLQKRFDFSLETIEKLAKVKIEPGYANVSSRAIKKMLPWLIEGNKYHEAAQNAGYHHSIVTDNSVIIDKLIQHTTTRNPIVDAAIHDLRRVVNAIIDRYGKPDKIVIEMARDMGKNSEDRRKLIAKQKDNEKYNNYARNEIEKYFANTNRDKQVTKNDIIKFKLWLDQKEVCIYSGKSISMSDLWNGNVDIDHILPLSQTLDDSYANKVVAFRSENALKSNRTPYQAFGADLNKWEGIMTRAFKLSANKGRKIKLNDKEYIQFIGENLEARLLNDTRYISRFAKEYLKSICKNVDVSNGTLTHYLRKLWGLNSILDEVTNTKNRDDHRHHSIDAVVVALTTKSQLQALSSFFGKRGWIHTDDRDEQFLTTQKIRERFALPWEDFRNDLKEKVSCVIVSYKQNKLKVSGALHEETFYGRRLDANGKFMTDANGVPLYYVKKPLTSLNDKQIKQIVDIKIKQKIYERLFEFGIDPSGKFDIPKDFYNEPIYIGDTAVKSVRISIPSNTMKQIRGYNIYVEPGSNHHMIVYKDIETGKQKGKVVTTFDAVMRKAKGLEPINKNLGRNEEFLFSLRINDLFCSNLLIKELDLNNKYNYSAIIEDIKQITGLSQTGVIKGKTNYFTKSISSMDKEEAENYRYLTQPSTIYGNKVNIDELGFVTIAND